MDTPGLFNKRQFAPDFILSQVTNDALKPSLPWLEKHMNTIETLIAGPPTALSGSDIACYHHR